MRNNILLPTDFSDNAWSAAVYALKLYAEEECTFYFLHSVTMKVSIMSNLSNKLMEVLRKNALNELLELKEMAQNTNVNPSHEFEIILSSDDLQAAIESAVEKHKIDLIVMGKKGTTADKELYFGSNTISTIKKLYKCPILIVPEEYDFEVPKQIAFPTDYNRFFGEKHLRPIKDLADLYNAKIRVMHINVEPQLNEIQEYNYTSLKEYLSTHDHSFHWMPDYEKKANEITDFIKELKIDILAMVNYKHNFFENIIKEPVIKKIGLHPIIPFLVIAE